MVTSWGMTFLNDTLFRKWDILLWAVLLWDIRPCVVGYFPMMQHSYGGRLAVFQHLHRALGPQIASQIFSLTHHERLMNTIPISSSTGISSYML